MLRGGGGCDGVLKAPAQRQRGVGHVANTIWMGVRSGAQTGKTRNAAGLDHGVKARFAAQPSLRPWTPAFWGHRNPDALLGASCHPI